MSEGSDRYVRCTVADGIGHITLARPDRGNALNALLLGSLSEAVCEVRRSDVAVVELTSDSSIFCVGGDLVEIGSAPQPGQHIADLADQLHRVIAELQQMDAIVVSAIPGVAAGAGVGLALAADVVLASDNARFMLGYSKVGLPMDGGASLLTASLGLHRTMSMALLNTSMSAREALQAGLVADVYPQAVMRENVEEVLIRLRDGSRGANVAIKRLVRSQAVPNSVSAMAFETQAIRWAAGSADGVEGIRAFAEKRTPRFVGDVPPQYHPTESQ
jgi:2-(1,2-epoxy-1,2-dihydrophenyl)acetyl-CoA isomerase